MCIDDSPSFLRLIRLLNEKNYRPNSMKIFDGCKVQDRTSYIFKEEKSNTIFTPRTKSFFIYAKSPNLNENRKDRHEMSLKLFLR